MAVEDRRLAVGRERELGDLDVPAGGAGLGLAEPDTGDLRLAVSTVRVQVVVDRLDRLSGDAGGGDQALRRCHVRQLGRARHDIADGVDAHLSGFHIPVHRDESAVGRDCRVLEADILRVGLAADRDEQLFELPGLLLSRRVFEGQIDAARSFLDLVHGRAGKHLDALGLERSQQPGRDFFVFEGNHAGQHLEEGDIRSEATVHRGELDSHRASADDRERSGHLFEVQNFDVRQHAPRLYVQARQHAGFRAGRQDDVRGFQRALPVRTCHLDLAGSLQRCVSGYGADLVALEQLPDTGCMLAHDFGLALAHRLEINRDAIGQHADLLAVERRLVHLRKVQQGLGRDTADVQASASQVRVLFDHSNLEAILCSANSRYVATGPAADDQDIVIHGQIAV